MGNLRTYGNVMISTPTDVFTFGDVKDFVKALEQLRVPDSAVLEDGFLVYEYSTQDVQTILCGEHKVGEGDFLDFVIPAHKCEVFNEQ